MFTARHAGRTVRCLIVREALEQVFGAGEEPASWLQAYQRHAATIERVAAERYAASPGPAVLLFRRRDFTGETDGDDDTQHNRHSLGRLPTSAATTTVSPWG